MISMNEHDFFQELIRERAVNDAQVKARACAERHRPVSWRRIAMIAAASAAVLIGTVFLIPSARAEVLSWFGARPEEYLAASDSERETFPEIKTLVSTPAPEETEIGILPIDRTDSKAINSEKALEISDFLYKNCDVSLGNALYDGEDFYQAVRLDGLSGLYLLDQYLPGTEFCVPTDPLQMMGMYQDGLDERYLTGEWTLYEKPSGYIWYELPNGKRWRGELELADAAVAQQRKTLESIIPRPMGALTEEQQQAVSTANRAFLEQTGGLTAVAHIFYPNDFGINELIDENGNLTVRAYYQVCVIEADRPSIPDTDLFWADLGTITINMYAADALEPRQMSAQQSPVAWDGETLTLSRMTYTFDEDRDSMQAILERYRVSTEGVVMVANTAYTTVNAIGIRDVRVRIITPSDWTDAERKAFAECLWFDVLIDGQTGNWYTDIINCSVQPDGTVCWSAGVIRNIPYETLRSVKIVTLIPSIIRFNSVEVRYDDGTSETLVPTFGETVESRPDIVFIHADDEKLTFSAYALTLAVEGEESR